MALQQAVLIVDNCLEDRLNYERYLLADPQQSYTVVGEATGKGALAVCQKLRLDCILIEYLLPDMNGLEFIAQLKQQAVMPAVIMLTRHGNEVVAVQAMKSGIQDYLVKQQTTAELLQATIHSAITNARLRQQLQLSGERFQLAAAAVNSAIYDWDIENNTVVRTEGLRQILGYSLEDVESTVDWWIKCIHPDDVQRVCDQTANVLATGDRYTLEYRLLHKNGQYKYVLDQGLIVRNTAGQAVRVVGNTMDISDRKLAEADREKSEAKFRRIVNSNIFGVYFGDFSGRVAEANDAFLEMVGYTREDLEAGIIYWDRMTPPEYQELDRQKVQQIREFGVCTPFEKEYLHKDGTRIPILLGIAQIEGREDEGYSACFVLDLTRSKQAEAERTRLLELEKAARAVSEAAQSAAEAANRAKDEFVAMVSHDLRSPLNAILGWTQLLRARKVDEMTAARALETIERNAKSQAKLLEDLLNISRILQGKLKLQVCQVNLVTIVEEVMATAYPVADAKNIRLVSVISGSIPPIAGDPDRLQQVLGNLLSNAIKFTPEGGQVEVQLSVVGNGEKTSDSPSSAQITVSDTGIGISPDFLPYVFERYRQADEADRQGGLGLGLAIALQLIELHGGTIQVDSPGEGQGATFTINLPYYNGRLMKNSVPSPRID